PDQSDDAGDVDNPSAATLQHSARHGPDAGEGTAKVGVLHRIPVLVLEPHYDVVAGNAGVVDQDVDRSESLLDVIDEFGDGGGVADIGGKSLGAISDSCRGFV